MKTTRFIIDYTFSPPKIRDLEGEAERSEPKQTLVQRSEVAEGERSEPQRSRRLCEGAKQPIQRIRLNVSEGEGERSEGERSEPQRRNVSEEAKRSEADDDFKTDIQHTLDVQTRRLQWALKLSQTKRWLIRSDDTIEDNETYVVFRNKQVETFLSNRENNFKTIFIRDNKAI